MIKFLECGLCGVAFDVGAKACNEMSCLNRKIPLKVHGFSYKVPINKNKAKRKQSAQSNSMARLYVVKSRSIKKGLSFDISLKDVERLILGPCVYCSSSIKIEIDRKDNNLGYTKDNTCSACKRCNTLKNNHLSYEEMLKFTKFMGWSF
jgi:hypothetical protein